MKETLINYSDLFAGCGGLSFGFQENSNYNHILATDIWEQAKKTYTQNFKNSEYLLADLTKEKDLDKVVEIIENKVDILMGGPPCKGFSTLNNSKIISKYNTLVDQFLTIINRVNPPVFLIENVRGFKSKKHPSEVTYPEHVKSRLNSFNPSYNTCEFILNAYDYGIPQNRVRYFMIGSRKDIDIKGSFLTKFQFELENRIINKKSVLRDAIGDLPKVKVREGADIIELETGKKIFNHKSMNHSDKLIERFKFVPKDGGLMDVPYKLLTNHLKKVVDGAYGSGGFSKNIYGRMNWDKPSGTIVAGMDKITIGRFVHPDEHRLLTPRECARIQTFPDKFVFTGGMVSQYYQIGNAVPPKLSNLFANIFYDIGLKDLTLKQNQVACN